MYAIIKHDGGCMLAKELRRLKRTYSEVFEQKTRKQPEFEIICSLQGSYSHNSRIQFSEMIMRSRENKGLRVYPFENEYRPIKTTTHTCDTPKCHSQIFLPFLVSGKKKYLCSRCVMQKYVLVNHDLVQKNKTISIDGRNYKRGAIKEYTNMNYCKKCHSFYSIIRGCTCFTGVEDYRRTVGVDFYHTKKESLNNRYYGIEHELSSGSSDEDDRYECSNALGKRFREMVTKEDGSVSGFECVFQPMTLKYIQSFDWRGYIRVLKEHSLRHTAECGLHIHVNASSIPVVLRYKLFKFFESNLNHIYTLSERQAERLDEWARWRYDYGILQTIYDNEHSNRYVMINLQNAKTVEFRFFNGTISAKKIIGRIEIIASILAYLEKHSVKDINKFNNYIEFVLKNELTYPSATQIITRLFINS